MARPTLEARVAALETEVKQLKQQHEPDMLPDAVPWWKKRLLESFRAILPSEEAVRFGREWRESQRPDDYEDVD